MALPAVLHGLCPLKYTIAYSDVLLVLLHKAVKHRRKAHKQWMYTKLPKAERCVGTGLIK